MSIAFGGVVAFLFRGLNLVLAFSMVLLTSNSLSKGEYGIFSLGLTVIGIVNAVTGGLTAATAYQVANQRRSPRQAAVTAGAIALGLGLCATATGVSLGESLSGKAAQVALPAGLASAAILLNSVVAGAFLGQERIVRYNVALIAPPLASLVVILAVFFLLNERTPEGALAGFAAGQWVALALLLLSGRPAFGGGGRLDPAMARVIGRFAFLAGLASGISYLNYRADVFVVDHFEGEEGVGTYNLAVYLAESVWQVSGSLALATYARVGSLSRPEAVALTTRVMRHTVVMLLLICGLLFAVAGAIQDLLFPDYGGMETALRYLLPGVLVYGLAQSFSGFYTYQRGMPWVSAAVAGTGLVVDMALAVTLVPRMGVPGAALASTLAYSTAMAVALAAFLISERLSPLRIVAFGRSEVRDYRDFARALRSRLSPANDAQNV
jgi:O-antigen/teichoic acid export membrane protein